MIKSATDNMVVPKIEDVQFRTYAVGAFNNE
jgi:hypothetical protein